MANTIIELRRSNVSGNVPTSLANGEIAINTYDGKLFYRGGASNTIQTIERFEGPAGLNGEIQFNDSGVLGSSNKFTFNKTTGLLTVSNTINVSGRDLGAHINAAFLTANNSLNANAGGTVTGDVTISANLTAGNVTTSGTANLGSLITTNNFTLGSQIFYPQSTRGFSVNENFDASGTNDQTAYHFTSGSGKTNAVFTIARSGQFTSGFGVSGTSSDNKFIIFGEQNNTGFEFRKGVGIQPVKLSTGTLLASLSSSGNFLTTGNVTASNVVSQSYIEFGDGTRQYTANTGGASTSNVTITTFATTANGAQTTFNLGWNPVSAETVIATIDGVIQPDSSYNVSNTANTITFTTAPASGEAVRVISLYSSACTNLYIIADGSVTTPKIADDAVTVSKLSQSTEDYILEKSIAMSIALG